MRGVVRRLGRSWAVWGVVILLGAAAGGLALVYSGLYDVSATRQHGAADGRSITPATPREDAEALRWSFWVMTEVEKDALTVLMHRFAMAPQERRPELADKAEQRLHVPLRVLEQHLAAQQARGEAHLAADRFTVADLCVASVLLWVRATRSLMEGYPLTSAWLAACVAGAQREDRGGGAGRARTQASRL